MPLPSLNDLLAKPPMQAIPAIDAAFKRLELRLAKSPASFRDEIEALLRESFEAGYLRGVMYGLTDKGIVHSRIGDFSDARALYRQAIACAEKLDDVPMLAKLYNCLGTNDTMASELETGIAYLHRSLKLRESLGDIRGVITVLNNIGTTHHELGNYEEALDNYSKALDLANQSGVTNDEGMLMGNVAECCMRLSDYANAEIWFEKCVARYEREEDIEGLGYVYASLGEMKVLRGETKEGREFLEKALDIKRHLDDDFTTCATLIELGKSYETGDGGTGVVPDPDVAERYYAEARDIATSKEYNDHIATANVRLASARARRGKPDETLVLLSNAEAAAGKSTSRVTRIMVEKALYEHFKREGDAAGALDKFERYHELVAEEHKIVIQAIRGHMTTILDVDHLRKSLEVWSLASNTDALTGAHNRRFMDARLPALLKEANAAGTPLSLAMCDLDHFKTVNDSYGHAAGDDVLRELVRLLRKNLRTNDSIFRYGGEEFLIVIQKADLQSAFQICEKLRHATETHDWGKIAKDLAITISIGLQDNADALRSADELIAEADKALYWAKESGRNKVVAFAQDLE